MAWWSRNGCGNTLGRAWIATICDKYYGTSLNEKQYSVAGSARVIKL